MGVIVPFTSTVVEHDLNLMGGVEGNCDFEWRMPDLFGLVVSTGATSSREGSG